MSFEQLLQDRLGPHRAEEVTLKIIKHLCIQIQELILDRLFNVDKFTEEHKTTLEKYSSLIHLTLNSVGLTSLENFPQLNDAQIVSNKYNYFLQLSHIYFIQIELNDNKLNGDDLEILVQQCPNLYKIKLEKNNIDNLDKLKCLAGHKITKINLADNPIVASNANYKNELFELIPTLITIDGTNKDGEPVESTLYGDEEDEEEDDESYDDGEGDEKEDDVSGEDFEDEDDEDDEDEEDVEDEKPNKKSKH